MIEVGEYVRIKNGEIHKVIEINNPNDELWTYYKFENNMGKYKENIKKHSKNISDLIEVGDYVNGFIVFDIITRDNGEKVIQLMHGVLLEQDKIDSIVTHEQFESMKYKVEDD